MATVPAPRIVTTFPEIEANDGSELVNVMSRPDVAEADNAKGPFRKVFTGGAAKEID
jgi:hypothetical protein